MTKPIKRSSGSSGPRISPRKPGKALAFANFFAKTFKAKLDGPARSCPTAPACTRPGPKSRRSSRARSRRASPTPGSSSTDVRDGGRLPGQGRSSPRARRSRSSLDTAQGRRLGPHRRRRGAAVGARAEPHRGRHPPDLRGSRIPVLVTKGRRPGRRPSRRSSSRPISRPRRTSNATTPGGWPSPGREPDLLYVLELFGRDFRLTDEMFKTVLKKLEARRRRRSTGPSR